MIKILFFIPNLSSGGAEKVLCSLVNSMDQKKFEITVQTIEKEYPEKYLAEGIRYRSIRRGRSKAGQKIFTWWFRLLAELKLVYPLYIKGDYDIEIAYLECDATKVMAASTNQKALKLAWVHCDLGKKEDIAENAAKIKQYYQNYDQVICVSEDALAAYRKLFGPVPESRVLPNVIDDEEIRRKAEEPLPIQKDSSKKYFLAVGRLTRQKGFDKLIEVFSSLRDAGYPVHLWILGEGPERDRLSEGIRAYQAEDVIELMGFQENPYPYMKMADCVVCSSIFEGFSTVVTEALILERPVITTPCAGMRELLGDSAYGMIAADMKDGLYHSIRSFLESDDLEMYYTDAARKRGTVFSKARTSEMIQNYFIRELARKQEREN